MREYVDERYYVAVPATAKQRSRITTKNVEFAVGEPSASNKEHQMMKWGGIVKRTSLLSF